MSMTAARTPQLQDTYLAEMKRQAIPVTVYLVNGFQLKGQITGYDAFTIILDYEHKPHLVYKHAVSTISPNGPVTLTMGSES
jgi:host factor-I protein